MSFTFQKNHKLKNSRDITELFISGKSIYFSPLKVKYLIFPVKTEPPILAGFTVSKKLFKSAVIRNLLKRRMREAYRLNKQLIENQLGNSQKRIHVMFIYQYDRISTYLEIENSVKQVLNKLINFTGVR